MYGYTNVSFFTGGGAKAILSEGIVPVNDDGDEILSQMVTLTLGNQSELILWLDDILPIAQVLQRVMERAEQRRDRYEAEVSTLYPQMK